MATLEKTINLLDKVTDAGNRAKITLDGLVETMTRNPSKAMYANIVDELNRVIALEERRIALIKQANSLRPVANSAASGYVGHPPGSDRAAEQAVADTPPIRDAAKRNLSSVATSVRTLYDVDRELGLRLQAAIRAL